MVEFRERIRVILQEQHVPVLVSAHSQGSIIAFAALSSLTPAELARVAFVTYGSPIAALYGKVSPAYFGPSDVLLLASRLCGGSEIEWANFYPDTDPIGGRVFAPPMGKRDQQLEDPAIMPEVPDTPDPSDPEPDRSAWTDLAGHSHYHREPGLKQRVRSVKAILAERSATY